MIRRDSQLKELTGQALSWMPANWWPEIILLLLFVAAGVVIDCRLASHLDIDSHRYLEIGENLYAGRGFVVTSESGIIGPDFSRTPILPALIAAALIICGGKSSAAILLVVWIQRIAWALAVLWAMPRTIGRGGGFRRWTFCGKLVLLFSPAVLWHSALLLTDVPYATGLLVLLCMMRRVVRRQMGVGGALCSGAVHGILTLTRPFHLLAPLAELAPWFFARRWRMLTLVLIPAFLLPGVWMLRNSRQGQPWTLTTVGGRSLALHQHSNILALPAEDAPGRYGAAFVRAMHSTDEGAYTAAWILKRDYNLGDAEVDRIARDVAVAAIKRRPVIYLREVLRNLGRLVFSPIDGANLARALGNSEQVIRLAGVFNAIWGLLCFLVVPLYLALCRIPGRLLGTSWAVSLLLLGAYLVVLPAMTTVTYGRFILPLLPLLGILYCAADIEPRRTRPAT